VNFCTSTASSKAFVSPRDENVMNTPQKMYEQGVVGKLLVGGFQRSSFINVKTFSR
jgi:hypothetical protein